MHFGWKLDTFLDTYETLNPWEFLAPHFGFLGMEHGAVPIAGFTGFSLSHGNILAILGKTVGEYGAGIFGAWSFGTLVGSSLSAFGCVPD